MIDPPKPRFDPVSMPFIRWLRDLVTSHDKRLDRIDQSVKNVSSAVSSIRVFFSSTLANITDTVNSLLVNYYTKSETDAKVASPGAISPTTVSASGALSSSSTVSGTVGIFPSGVKSTSVYGNILPSSYRSVYVTSSDGSFGYVGSSRRFKQDIADAPDIREAALAIRLVTFRYIEAVKELGDTAAIEWGVIAEEMDALGLTWAVDYDAEGKPFGVKYERLVLAVIPVMQDHEERLKAAGL